MQVEELLAIIIIIVGVVIIIVGVVIITILSVNIIQQQSIANYLSLANGISSLSLGEEQSIACLILSIFS